jgi:hypothetical protein
VNSSGTTLDEARIRLERARRDEIVDGRRADEAYAKHQTRKGRICGQYAREAGSMVHFLEELISSGHFCGQGQES